jgi:lysophospholipase L1-like esterase
MLGRFGLALAALVAGLLVAEVGVRALDRARCLMSFSGSFWEPDRYFGWRHTAGASGWAKHCIGTQTEWRTFTRINGLGLRDRDIPHAHGDAFRILVLGDSMAEGVQVDADETFPKQLERRLNAGGRRRVEVINAGCSAYGTDNEVLFYRDEGRKYRPDLVLLAFNTWNDVLENYRPLFERTGGTRMYPPKPYFLAGDGRLVLHDYPLARSPRLAALRERANRALWRYSTLYRLVVTLGLPRVAPVAMAAAPQAARWSILGVLLRRYPPEWRAAWGITAGLVRRLQRDVARDGARLAVVVLTSSWEVSDDRWVGMLAFNPDKGTAADFDREKPTRIMGRLLARLGIPGVPLLEPFREQYGGRGLAGYFDSDFHLKDDGHAFAAEVIERGLVEAKLVPEATP